MYFWTTLVTLILECKSKNTNNYFYKEYFSEFFVKQRPKVKDKIIWTLDLIAIIDKIPETYLKHLDGTNKLYEIRVQSGNDIFRIFCFFDDGNLVVLANGFQKKSQKTPKQEIEKALNSFQ